MHCHPDCPQDPGASGFRGPSTPMGRGAVLCLAGAKSTSGKRLRSFNRIRDSLPLCRLSHATGQTNGSFCLSSESDSKDALWAKFSTAAPPRPLRTVARSDSDPYRIMVCPGALQNAAVTGPSRLLRNVNIDLGGHPVVSLCAGGVLVLDITTELLTSPTRLAYSIRTVRSNSPAKPASGPPA